MNLKPLFETQRVLRDRIRYNEPDRFRKLILALLVEIGECANEWRGFKFWSKNQKARTHELTYERHGEPPVLKNFLLEEYVDGLHFVLELGLEHHKELTEYSYDKEIAVVNKADVTTQFNLIFNKVTDYFTNPTKGNYVWMVELYLGLGTMLGFTWEQIEQAYYDKNKINHERQENGY